ncbi:MAG: pyruvate ferredoxin oxidoreductase [Deltaproteobacteria bacterium]|nr:pyruvate ferredoxin oxidoreductase [Deltaproteobacteria bacterium]
MQKQAILLGSDAIANGVKLCRPAVISAYPITPQTHIIETLSEMVDRGELESQYIKVESEMSAIAAVLGSVSAGSRSFTASSSQGLAMMHEVLHWFAGARLPLVLVNANRALGAPWNIWSDQSDSFSQRDTGWLQIYCETSQEALDTIIIAYKASEQLMLPIMVMIDGFILSHTMERLLIPDQQLVDDYLPAYQAPYRLDPDDPLTFGAAAQPDLFYELKKTFSETMSEAPTVLKNCEADFRQAFARAYSPVMRCPEGDEKSDTAIICCGAMTGTARVAVADLNKRGLSTDLLKIRLLRPFPKDELCAVCRDKKRIIVLNRACSYGVGGTLSQEVRAALYHLEQRPLVNDVMISLGGKEVFPETIAAVIENREELSSVDCNWLK